jgi:hypothetical protein
MQPQIKFKNKKNKGIIWFTMNIEMMNPKMVDLEMFSVIIKEMVDLEIVCYESLIWI